MGLRAALTAVSAACAVIASACIDFDALRGECADAGRCSADGGGSGTGGGGGAGAASLRFTPTSAAVTVPAGGTPVPYDFKLINDGNAPAIGLDFTGTCLNSPFMQTTTCTATLAPGGQCTVTVRFAPQVQQLVTCSVTANETGGHTATAMLTGNSSTLLVSPLPITFADRELDAGAGRQTVSLQNAGLANVPPLTLGLQANTSFSLDADLCSTFALPLPDAGCSVEVVFTPTSEGLNSTALNITPLNQATLSVPVSGVGYAAFDVSIVLPAGNLGAVLSGDAGLDCPGDCTEHLRRGRRVDVLAVADAGYTFTAWDAGPCLAQGAACNFVVDGGAALQPFFDRPNRIFITSATVNGDLALLPDGGGGRVDCTTFARDAGLSGTFFPVLYSDAGAALTRLPATNRGWVRPDGLPVADSYADLMAGRFYYPPDLTERGERGDGNHNDVWVGNATNSCTWFSSSSGSGAVGAMSGAGPHWLQKTGTTATSSCTPLIYKHHVLCAETGHVVPVSGPPPIPAGGRRAFLSQPHPVEARAAANQSCQQEATAHGLPGTYVALRSYTDGGFNYLRTDAGTWYRLDGVKLFTQPIDVLLNGGGPLAAINLLADAGPVLDGNGTSVWSGVLVNPNNTPTPGQTCQNWSATDTGTARSGIAEAPWEFLVTTVGVRCDAGARYYCFEN